MYKLIGTTKARPFRVLWAMEEIGLQYELINCAPHHELVTEHNPGGKVPVFLDGDNVIVDSVAIIQYLADKHNALTYSAGTIERARQDSFTQFACDDLDGILWSVAKHSFVYPVDKRIEGVKASSEWDFNNSLRDLEARLGGGDYVMGDKFTVPDIIIGHCAGWAMNTGFAWPEGKITDYFNRVRSRPAFVKAMEVREAA